ncbi:MAG: 16S rRNA (cytosine(967)-C(5))-methyltransferase RsmB [Candidatus Accumulibacter sp.]|nr:16S rRNA (cytosine(967)-C(5))-methyltransferase RsmB [Accumulibacter sp.]
MTTNSASRGLAADSLGYSLLLAARVLATVHAGKSLNEALPLLTNEPETARAAAQDLVYGVLRGYGRGEFFLARLMERPLSHTETQALLLAALYRLETRSQSAPMIVDQAVAAAGELANGAFKGVVNGVLRNFLRQRERLLTELSQDETAYFQHPAWWLARLRRAWPKDWPDIVTADNGPPPMSLRVNTRRISVADYLEKLRTTEIAATPIGNVGLRLETPRPVDRLPGFAEGWVSVQDAGAQRAAEWLDPAPGEHILDACAAPGGKTAHLLERADAKMLALDIDAVRVKRIEDNLKRLGLTAETRVADCLAVDTWWDGRRFDAILADVPCSASGVARRRPDIKIRRRESDVRKFAHAQTTFLDTLWPLLKPGGRFLYATCSVFVEENTAQIDAFLARWPDARRVGQEQWLPNRDNDGFYYALLRKT